MQVGWIRRTRTGGDDWESYEVPLGEERERYLVRVIEAGTIKREVVVTTDDWSYSITQQTADGVSGGFSVSVAQISAVYGPGLFATIEVAQ